MLTQEQIDINQEVQDSKQKFPDQGELFASLIIDEEYHRIDDLHFIMVSINKHKNLLLMLDILEQKLEFLINCVYLYRVTLKNYIFESIDPNIAEEYTKRDIVELFEYYELIPIKENKI